MLKFLLFQTIYTWMDPRINVRHIGHCWRRSQQLWHTAKCPHGISTTERAVDMQTAQTLSWATANCFCYHFPFWCIYSAIRVAFTSRCNFIVSCVAQPSLLIESRYLVLKLCIICYRAVRRGLDRTPAPRPCLCLLFFLLCFLASIARQPRSKSCPFCCSRLAKHNEKRSSSPHCVDSLPLL